MFRITRGKSEGKYRVDCYIYKLDRNTNDLLYSADNISDQDVEYLLQSSGVEDTRWALDIARLTNGIVVIGEDGEIIPTTPIERKSYETRAPNAFQTPSHISPTKREITPSRKRFN